MMEHRPGAGDEDRRRHVGMTMPRAVKEQMLSAAEAIGWPAGRWALTAAAEHGPGLQEALRGRAVLRRVPQADPAFAALYLTLDERAELDDLAVACGLNRSAFVTAVARLALGQSIEDVRASLVPGPGTTEEA